MLVLLLTMRTWWYKEGVGRVAGGTDVDSAEDVPPSDKKRAEGANLHIHIVARCRGRGLGGEAVDGVIPRPRRLPRRRRRCCCCYCYFCYYFESHVAHHRSIAKVNYLKKRSSEVHYLKKRSSEVHYFKKRSSELHYFKKRSSELFYP